MICSTVFYRCWTKPWWLQNRVDKWLWFSMVTDTAEKPPFWLLEGAGSLLPGDWERDFLRDFSWSFAAVVYPVYCLIFSNCTETLSSYSTRHHLLRFSNRYACWLNFCKDHGFHPKVRGANRFFFPIKWTLDFLIHFSDQSCNSLTFFNFGTSQKLFNSFQSLDYIVLGFNALSETGLTLPKGMYDFSNFRIFNRSCKFGTNSLDLGTNFF